MSRSGDFVQTTTDDYDSFTIAHARGVEEVLYGLILYRVFTFDLVIDITCSIDNNNRRTSCGTLDLVAKFVVGRR